MATSMVIVMSSLASGVNGIQLVNVSASLCVCICECVCV